MPLCKPVYARSAFEHLDDFMYFGNNMSAVSDADSAMVGRELSCGHERSADAICLRCRRLQAFWTVSIWW